MHPARISLIGAAAAAIVAPGLIVATDPAQATTSTVSPGDELMHVAQDGPHRCTLGYTFTNAAGPTASPPATAAPAPNEPCWTAPPGQLGSSSSP
jgi:hypothetical protein